MIENRIKISEIFSARRIDPSFYRSRAAIKGLVSLSSYVNVKGGKRIPKGETFTESETPFLYLRISDIGDYERLNYSNFKYISAELFRKLERYEIGENELAFSIAGTIGRVFIVNDIPLDKRVILTENCAKLIIKEKRVVLPEYLQIVLNLPLVQQQINSNRIQTTIPKIGLDRIGKLQIPAIPPIEVQRRIVDIYSKASDEKRAKEQQAQALLASIDPYLLEQLGITLPQTPTRQLAFKIKISEMLGNRIDVSFYRERFELISPKYPSLNLSEILHINPSVKYAGLTDNDEISFVPMEVIDEKKSEIAEHRTTTIVNTKGFTKFEDNDLLWAKITPCMQNGKSAIARNLINGCGCGSTEFYVLRPKSTQISIEYIHMIMRNKMVLESAKNSFGGSAGQQRVSSDYLKSIKIPTPPPAKQNEIVETINTIRAKASALQAEASAQIEKAKAQIEKIILEANDH